MERIPPHNLAAEKAVIGACLLNEAAIFAAMEVVRPPDFYRKEHQQIFEIIMDLNAQGVPCDMVTVLAQLEKKGLLDQIGGVSYLAELTAEVPSAASAAHYGRIVSDKSLQRALIQASQKVVDDGYRGQKDSLELLGDAEAAISDVSERKLKQNFREAGDLMMAQFELIDSLKAKDGVTGVPTLKSIDYFLSGLQPGDMIVLAARPGAGKTSLAMNIAANAGSNYGMSAAVFSLEMPAEQLAQRMLCSRARVDQSHWRSGRLKQEEIDDLSEALTAFTDSKIFIDDTPGITMPEIRAKCRRLQGEKGLNLIVIDYLQLMRLPYRVDSRQVEIAEISRSIKQLAKELKVPVLALSQLSRQSETSDQPMLSHLRESGAIEQDADVVLFLHRKHSEHEEDDEMDGIVEMIVAKNRNGPTGERNIAFQKQYTLFADLAVDFPPLDQ